VEPFYQKPAYTKNAAAACKIINTRKFIFKQSSVRRIFNAMIQGKAIYMHIIIIIIGSTALGGPWRPLICP
jgi:hypothetical protein